MDDAHVVVKRPVEFAGRYRRVRIFVDGALAVRLRAGQAADITADPGGHTLEARLDWLRSPPLALELTPGERRDVVCSTAPMMALAAAGLFALFSRGHDRIALFEAGSQVPEQGVPPSRVRVGFRLSGVVLFLALAIAALIRHRVGGALVAAAMACAGVIAFVLVDLPAYRRSRRS